jgi:hypothetical protein
VSNIGHSDDWFDGYTTGFADADKPISDEEHRAAWADEIVDLRRQLKGALEERDALQKLVNLYREYGSPDLTRLVNHEAMRTPPAGGQSSGDRRITTSRSAAQGVTCPRCGAAPGQPCTGARGKVRESMHRERHQALEGGEQ